MDLPTFGLRRSSFGLHIWQVSGVAFDPFWSPPNSDDTGESVVYRFGSVGQVSGIHIHVSAISLYDQYRMSMFQKLVAICNCN